MQKFAELQKFTDRPVTLQERTAPLQKCITNEGTGRMFVAHNTAFRPTPRLRTANPHFSFPIQAEPGKPSLCRNFGRNAVKIQARTLRFAIRWVCAVPATLTTCGPAYMRNPG